MTRTTLDEFQLRKEYIGLEQDGKQLVDLYNERILKNTAYEDDLSELTFVRIIEGGKIVRSYKDAYSRDNKFMHRKYKLWWR